MERRDRETERVNSGAGVAAQAGRRGSAGARLVTVGPRSEPKSNRHSFAPLALLPSALSPDKTPAAGSRHQLPSNPSYSQILPPHLATEY